jgi:hypothetical protein
MAKKKMGRPPIDPSGPLGRLLQIRLSDADHDDYERAADKAGMKLSAWIRDCLSKAATKAQKKR